LNPLDHRFALVEILIQELAGLSDLEGNTVLHLIGQLNRGPITLFEGSLVLKLIEAGEDLLALNHEGKMAAELLHLWLMRWHSRVPRFGFDFTLVSHDEPLVIWKIIIHFMKELRQAETTTRLNDEHIDLPYFFCNRLIDYSKYSDDKAEALMQETVTQSDHLALGYLQTQKASGWQLPACRFTYRMDDRDEKWYRVKSSDKSSTTDEEDDEERRARKIRRETGKRRERRKRWEYNPYYT
jgi:hypothetical protein